MARRALLLAAYALPAVAVWAALGGLVNSVPLRQVATVLLVLYAAWYGVIEALGIPGHRPPGSQWQVPKYFVRHPSARRRILVWGTILGPGFFTRNPYAGFGLLPLAVAAIGNVRAGLVVAAAVGFAHGTGRALALLRDARAAGNADYMRSVLRSMYYRIADGYALLALGGIAVIVCLSIF